jgi:hypothetical protein
VNSNPAAEAASHQGERIWRPLLECVHPSLRLLRAIKILGLAIVVGRAAWSDDYGSELAGIPTHEPRDPLPDWREVP